MTRCRPLPLAPRPMPGEAVLSWVRRLAARYDLEPAALVADLRGGEGVPAWRLSSLDWRADAELEHLLAQAARLDACRIAALRAITQDLPEPAAWHRRSLAWCPVCVFEDIALYRETYERAVWRLGCCAACPLHHLVLARSCLVCGCGRMGYRAVAGRLRLVCEYCRRPVDAPGIAGRRPAP